MARKLKSSPIPVERRIGRAVVGAIGPDGPIALRPASSKQSERPGPSRTVGMDYLIRMREEELARGPRARPPKRATARKEDKLFWGKLRATRPGEVPHGTGARYFAQIPNIVVDMPLGPHAIAVYVYYKKEAGANLKRRVRQGADRIARHLCMSKRSVLNAREELASRNLIAIENCLFNGTWGVEVTVLDIQDHNEELYKAGKDSWPDPPLQNQGNRARGQAKPR
jgi:hypothetical protein